MVADKAILETALRAIQARINGVFDDPALMSYGPLNADCNTDVLHIAAEALREHVTQISCSCCGLVWAECAVPQIRIYAGTVREFTSDGCDHCGTDEHLVDVIGSRC